VGRQRTEHSAARPVKPPPSASPVPIQAPAQPSMATAAEAAQAAGAVIVGAGGAPAAPARPYTL